MAIRRINDPPDLSPATVSILLLGWCAPEAPEPSPHGFAHGYLTLFESVNGREVGIIGLWQRYADFLRSKAAEWNWQAPYVRPRRHATLLRRILRTSASGPSRLCRCA